MQEVHDAMVEVLGGEEFFTRDAITPYYYSVSKSTYMLLTHSWSTAATQLRCSKYFEILCISFWKVFSIQETSVRSLPVPLSVCSYVSYFACNFSNFESALRMTARSPLLYRSWIVSYIVFFFTRLWGSPWRRQQASCHGNGGSKQCTIRFQQVGPNVIVRAEMMTGIPFPSTRLWQNDGLNLLLQTIIKKRHAFSEQWISFKN